MVELLTRHVVIMWGCLVGCDAARMLRLLLQALHKETLLQLWLPWKFFFLLTSSRVRIDQMFTDYRNTGV